MSYVSELAGPMDRKIARAREKAEDLGVNVETELRSNSVVSVTYDFEQHGELVRLVRRVWNLPHRRIDRVCLHAEVVAEWDSYGAYHAVSGLVAAYGSVCELEGSRPQD